MPATLSDGASGKSPARFELPLVVDLDGTLLVTDSYSETFVSALFNRPLVAIQAIEKLIFRGKAASKQVLAEGTDLDLETLPLRKELVDFLRDEEARGRSVNLATAADRNIAEAVAARLGLFSSVHASENDHNLKGARKAERLKTVFPQGFVYAGDCRADFPIWKQAAGAIVVSSDKKLLGEVSASGVPIERVFDAPPSGFRPWLKAARPHQWAKNILVMVPILLGLRNLSVSGALSAFVAMMILCVLASLTYMLNDIVDLSADRLHWSKSRRPFASGVLPVEYGLVAAGLGIPMLLGLGFWMSPGIGLVLLAYLLLTLAYSLRLKRVPILDVTILATLFTLRLALGVVAAGQEWSVWLLSFSMFFFFSLAIAKRHTELLRAATSGAGHSESGIVYGRGYHIEDNDVTLVYGAGASIASIVILVLYLTEEVLSRPLFEHPQYLWFEPLAVFLWTARVWLLSHRGQMTDDPLLFALKDRTSLAIGLAVAISLGLALI
ncbi:MAG: UbiA family prenyltransferase [Rhodoblastus sp.]|uniref:UbiA family prenyltransferase n=1 Tax=Rhodoblastus sp. TaxID=1962975 RepID=UPI003F9863FF